MKLLHKFFLIPISFCSFSNSFASDFQKKSDKSFSGVMQLPPTMSITMNDESMLKLEALRIKEEALIKIEVDKKELDKNESYPIQFKDLLDKVLHSRKASQKNNLELNNLKHPAASRHFPINLDPSDTPSNESLNSSNTPRNEFWEQPLYEPWNNPCDQAARDAFKKHLIMTNLLKLNSEVQELKTEISDIKQSITQMNRNMEEILKAGFAMIHYSMSQIEQNTASKK